jgi:hypothetical protein
MRTAAVRCSKGYALRTAASRPGYRDALWCSVYHHMHCASAAAKEVQTTASAYRRHFSGLWQVVTRAVTDPAGSDLLACAAAAAAAADAP